MIESTIERLEQLAALWADDYWGAPLLPGALETDIAEIGSLVWPSRIPEELLRFWRFREGGPITDVLCGVEIQGPRECAANYLMLQEEPFHHPRALLPLGYGYQLWLCVELDTAQVTGGRLWRVQNDDSGMCEIFPSLGFALEFAVMEMERLGRRPELEEIVERHLGGPTYTVEGLDQFVPLEWPEHWRDLQGLASSELLAIGATTTVAGVLDGTAEEPWILAGTVKVIGGGGAGTIAVLSDDTGDIEFVATGRADPACLLGKQPVEIHLRRRELIPAPMSVEAAEERKRFARELAERAGLPPSVVGDFAANMDRASGTSAHFEAVHVRPTELHRD